MITTLFALVLLGILVSGLAAALRQGFRDRERAKETLAALDALKQKEFLTDRDIREAYYNKEAADDF